MSSMDASLLMCTYRKHFIENDLYLNLLHYTCLNAVKFKLEFSCVTLINDMHDLCAIESLNNNKLKFILLIRFSFST